MCVDRAPVVEVNEQVLATCLDALDAMAHEGARVDTSDRARRALDGVSLENGPERARDPLERIAFGHAFRISTDD